MEQKMITIPFDLELAKKIQNGEHPGKIVTIDGRDVRIACWDRKDTSNFCLIVLVDEGNYESSYSYTKTGESYGPNSYNLQIQVPEWTQFKDGDVLACEVDNGDGDYCKWFAILRGNVHFILSNIGFSSYVSYDYDSAYKNGELTYDEFADNIDSIRLATEEEKQMFIKRLKEENTDKAKEVLKRFFGIEEVEEKSECEVKSEIKSEVKCEFEPFQQVLVRNSEIDEWECSLFSNFNKHYSEFPFVCVSGIFNQCIPYNDETKHLVGTTDNWDV